MFERIIGFLKLDINIIEAVEADENATSQAAIMVGIVAVLAAIGAFFGARAGNAIFDNVSQFSEVDIPFEVPTISPVGAAANAFIGAFVAWIIWSALTYFIGTRLFEGQATMGEMLRVIGFAQAPRLLNIFGFIPCLNAILAFIAWIWAIVVSFVAIRQGLDLDNVKTAVTILVSWVIAILVNWLIVGPILGVSAHLFYWHQTI